MDRFFCSRRTDSNEEEPVDISQLEEASREEREKREREKELFQAIQNKDVNRIKELSTEGLNIGEAKNEHKRSALHCLASLTSPEDVNVLTEMFNLFLSKGCSVDGLDEYGNTPAKFAAENENIPLLKLLIDNEADLDKRDKLSEDTPLHWAAKNGKLKAVHLLISNKACIDIQNKQQKTALHIAVEARHKNVVLLLLHYKACRKHTDINKFTPYDCARTENFTEIEEIFKVAHEQIENKQQMLKYAEQNNFAEVVMLFTKKPERKSEGKEEIVVPDSPDTPAITNVYYHISMHGNAQAAIGDGSVFQSNREQGTTDSLSVVTTSSDDGSIENPRPDLLRDCVVRPSAPPEES